MSEPIGWIKIHRKIFKNPFYFSEPFNRALAWIDLILLANHEDNFFYKRGIKVDVKRGQVGYDLESLGIRWKWSRGKVERFILELENEGQIVRQKNNITTLLSIVNYSEYQKHDKADSKANDKADSKADSKANGSKQECKEVKNDKNDNNIRIINNPQMLTIPEKISAELFEDFCRMRKSIKKPLTEKAKDLAISKLMEFEKKKPGDANKSLEQSIMNSWQGLFEPKVEEEFKRTNQPNTILLNRDALGWDEK